MGADMVRGDEPKIRLVMASDCSYKCNRIDDWGWNWNSNPGRIVSSRNHRTGDSSLVKIGVQYKSLLARDVVGVGPL